MTPTISIITPWYNSSAWCESLVQTVQDQTFKDFEHLIVDDGSTDDGFSRLQKLAEQDTRIRLLRTERNSGPATARNVAIKAARGQYLAFLDADDLWLPKKLEYQLAWMQSTGHSFTFHAYRHISHDGARHGLVVKGPSPLTFKALHTHRGTGCLTVMIDRSQVSNFRFPDEDRDLPEDFLAWSQVIREGHIGHFLDKDLARYRLTDDSRSSNKLKAAKDTFNVYRHVEKLPAVTAMWWWANYLVNAHRLHKRAKPI